MSVRLRPKVDVCRAIGEGCTHTKWRPVIDTNSGTLGRLLAAVILTSAAPAWAADPIIGIWKLDVAESTFSTVMQDEPPKELIEVIREVEGDRIELAQNGTQEDGTRVTFRITYPTRGGS